MKIAYYTISWTVLIVLLASYLFILSDCYFVGKPDNDYNLFVTEMSNWYRGGLFTEDCLLAENRGFK